MTSDQGLLYWDSSVFLAYINGEQARLPIIDALLDEIEHDEARRVFTSSISQVEVAFATSEANTHALDPETESKIDALWQDRSVVEVVELHDEIALEARSLMRDSVTRGWSLKALDAIHLATARWLQATEFHTYDHRLEKYEPLVGFPVREPYAAQGRLPQM
jgi:predicted nucleic acid-binding protein